VARTRSGPVLLTGRDVEVTENRGVASADRETAAGTPLRGRDEHLRLIHDSLLAAVDGRGAAVFVEGRAGLGKTRLLHEAARIAGDLGIGAGIGTVATGDHWVPMGALLQALFDGVRPLLDPGERGRLPYLPEQRYWLLEELESLLERAAMRAPMLLCLDDMHAAAASCLAAVRTLPARLAGVPIVWLVAYRGGRQSQQVRDAVDSLAPFGAVATVLEPLGVDAVTQVVTDVMQAEPDQALLDLAQRAHGSPFLLVELLHGLREEATVRIDSGRATLLEARLPSRVRDSMRERLERMSPSALQVANVACVLGHTFTFDQLAAMVDATPAAMLAPVEELLGAELLSQQDGALTFRHDLLREAVRDSLPASAQRALQRQAVGVLLATGSSPVDVAAALAVSAVPGDQAAIETLRGAARALARYDPSSAADLSRRALDLTRGADPPRGPLAAETALMLHAAGRIREGKAFADAVLGEMMRPEQEAQVRLSLAAMMALSPDVRAEAGGKALALPAVPADLRARHVGYLVFNLLAAGRWTDAAQLLPTARTTVRTTADPTAAFALALAEAGQACAASDFATALHLVEAAIGSHAGIDEPVPTLIAQEMRCELLAALDRGDESLTRIAQNLAHARRDRQEWALRLWEGARGRRLIQLGRLTDGAAALDVLVEPPDQVALVSALEAAGVAALGRASIHTASRAALRRCVTTARALLDSDAPAVRRQAGFLLALDATAAGDPSAARDWVSGYVLGPGHEVTPMFPIDVTAAVVLVRIAVAAHDAELTRSAAAFADRRLPYNPGVASIAGSAAHARGLAAGDVEELLDAVKWFEQATRPLALASALEDAGVAMVRQGRRDDGVSMLGRALETYARVGASWDAGRVRARLRKLGVRRRLVTAQRPTNGWPALTTSEQEVARLVADGMTNREVADRLYLSTHTVGAHLRHVFTKLGVRSRLELARFVARSAQYE
jgi:DNA-binding CsgD family transcriptional regulator